MGKIIRNGIVYGSGANEKELTKIEYDALSEAEKNNGTTYYVKDEGSESIIPISKEDKNIITMKEDGVYANAATVHEVTEAEYDALSEAEKNNGDFYHIIDKETPSESTWQKTSCPFVCDVFPNVVRNTLLVSKDWVSINMILRGGVWNNYEWLTVVKTGIARSEPFTFTAIAENASGTPQDVPTFLWANYDTDGTIKVVNSNPPMPISELRLSVNIPRI